MFKKNVRGLNLRIENETICWSKTYFMRFLLWYFYCNFNLHFYWINLVSGRGKRKEVYNFANILVALCLSIKAAHSKTTSESILLIQHAYKHNMHAIYFYINTCIHDSTYTSYNAYICTIHIFFKFLLYTRII